MILLKNPYRIVHDGITLRPISEELFKLIAQIRYQNDPMCRACRGGVIEETKTIVTVHNSSPEEAMVGRELRCSICAVRVVSIKNKTLPVRFFGYQVQNTPDERLLWSTL
jgi:RNase P/RNase MRP subunit p29